MSKFVIGLNNGSREQRNAITTMLQAKKWGFWHNVEDMWLVAAAPDTLTSKALYEEIISNPLIGESALMVVIRIPSETNMTFWGKAKKDGWLWMSKYWGKTSQ